MATSPSPQGESRSRRSARPFILAIVAVAVLIFLVVLIVPAQETRDGAAQQVAPGDPAAVGAATAPAQQPLEPTPPGGQGTRDAPDLGPPLESTAPPKNPL